MDKEFVPKKTVTIQMTMETQRKLEVLLDRLELTKTKLLEKLIREAYANLYWED